jgi:hypothetical protein
MVAYQPAPSIVYNERDLFAIPLGR